MEYLLHNNNCIFYIWVRSQCAVARRKGYITLGVEAPVSWTEVLEKEKLKPDGIIMKSLIWPRPAPNAPKASLIGWLISKIPKPKRTAVPANKRENLGKSEKKSVKILDYLPAIRIIAIPKAKSFFGSWLWIHGKSSDGHHPDDVLSRFSIFRIF